MAGRAPIVPNRPKAKSLPLEERIQQRAHQIYLERGGGDGSAIDDWLQAEQEIRAEQESETSNE